MNNPIKTDSILIFTDGSFDPTSKMGIACYLCLREEPTTLPFKKSEEDNVKFKTFKNTTCSRLELQSMIWAINEVSQTSPNQSIVIYTDSETSANLIHRRNKLESKNFCNNKNQKLNNGDLYKIIFQLYDKHNISTQWVKGHKTKKDRNVKDHWFSIVDQYSRKKLRSILN